MTAQEITFRQVKPQATGAYLCIRGGQVYPVFVRIRFKDEALWVYGDHSLERLDLIEPEAFWSTPLLMAFSQEAK